MSTSGTPDNEELRDSIRHYFGEQIDYLKVHDPLVDSVMKLVNAAIIEAEKRAELRGRKEGYDPDRQGSWIFIGDSARLENLNDLYWSYVLQYVKESNPHDKYKLQYLKNNMPTALDPSSFFYGVGVHGLLFRADQHAKERMAQLHNLNTKEGEA